MSNPFKIGDYVVCINPEMDRITCGRYYEVIATCGSVIDIMDDFGYIAGYRFTHFVLYDSQNNVQQTTPEQHVKEFLKKLEYVLVKDRSVSSEITYDNEGVLLLTTDHCDITDVDDIYTYINNSYDQLTSQAAQKRKQELLDKKAKIDVELAEINKELEGL